MARNNLKKNNNNNKSIKRKKKSNHLFSCRQSMDWMEERGVKEEVANLYKKKNGEKKSQKERGLVGGELKW